MDVEIEKINVDQPERVLIQCYEITGEVISIADFVKKSSLSVTGYLDDRVSQITLQDIYYVESVDNRVFAYTEDKTFELKCKLYEFESTYKANLFFRCSKSMVINLLKIDYVSPILNGRFSAKMFNGEQVIISRQYVPELKEILSGGAL